jgi:hypothetical protein
MQLSMKRMTIFLNNIVILFSHSAGYLNLAQSAEYDYSIYLAVLRLCLIVQRAEFMNVQFRWEFWI